MTERVPRVWDVLSASEDATLRAFVADNRHEVLALLDGLTEEQARRRLVPSRTCVLAIVKHCAYVERVWFQEAVLGHSREILGIPVDVEDSWLLDDSDTITSVRENFLAAVAESERIAADLSSDDLAVHPRFGPLTVRWIHAHLVQELARHAGHGDILREQVLAANAE